jgi:hypothetical protein
MPYSLKKDLGRTRENSVKDIVGDDEKKMKSKEKEKERMRFDESIGGREKEAKKENGRKGERKEERKEEQRSDDLLRRGSRGVGVGVNGSAKTKITSEAGRDVLGGTGTRDVGRDKDSSNVTTKEKKVAFTGGRRMSDRSPAAPNRTEAVRAAAYPLFIYLSFFIFIFIYF